LKTRTILSSVINNPASVMCNLCADYSIAIPELPTFS
jgi:hypothetical protein